MDIRKKIKESGFTYWLVADRLGIADTTFSRWLRKELPKEKKEMILNAVEELKLEGLKSK